MNVEVTRYSKPDGYATRHWSVMVNGELLVVTLYRKGAEAVAEFIANLIMPNKSETSSQPGQPPVTPSDLPEGVPANVEPPPPAGLMLPLLESEAARRKRRRKGLRREILGEAPF